MALIRAQSLPGKATPANASAGFWRSGVIRFLLVFLVSILPLAGQAQTESWDIRLKSAHGPVVQYLGDVTLSQGQLTLRFTGTDPDIGGVGDAREIEMTGNLDTSGDIAQGEFVAEMFMASARWSHGITGTEQARFEIDGVEVEYDRWVKDLENRPMVPFMNMGSIFGYAATGKSVVPNSTEATRTSGGTASSIFEGVDFRLYNPVVSKDGSRIEWSWRYWIRGLEDREVSGGPDQGTPLVWEKRPRIDRVFVANDQTAISETLGMLYPRAPHDPPETSVPRPEPKYTRDLIIIGSNLGALDGKTPTGLDGAVIYGPVEPFKGSALAEDLMSYDPAAPRLNVIHAATRAAKSDELELRRIGVDIAGRIDPGTQYFKFDATGGAWLLRYGEALGQIGILRPRSSALLPPAAGGTKIIPKTSVQPASYVFGEEVVFVARLDEEIKADTIRLQVVDAPGAPPAPEAPGTGRRDITLTRSKADPTFYRSDSFVLADREFWHDDAAVTAFNTREDRPDNVIADPYHDLPADLAITLVRDSTFRVDFVPGQNITRLDPVPDGPVGHADTTIRGDYPTALKKAHGCKPTGDAAIDWDRLTLEESGTISLNLIPWDANELDYRYGQHAALLLARARLLHIVENDDVDDLVDIWRAGPRNPELPRLLLDQVMGRHNRLARLTIYPEFQQLVSQRLLFASFERYDEVLRDRLLQDYAQTVYFALNRFITARAGALKTLRETDDCDMLGLIKIGVDGIDPILQASASELTRIEQVPKSDLRLRRPDTVGRREMLGLTDLFAQYEIRKEWQDEEWLYIKGTITLAGLALGGVGTVASFAGVMTAEVSLATAAGLAYDGLDLAAACTDAYCGATESAMRRALAETLANDLGTDRLDFVRRDIDYTALSAALDVAMSGAGALFSVKDVFQAQKSLKFRNAADGILSASRGVPKPTVDEARKARRIVRKFFKDLSADPTKLDTLKDYQRNALLATLADRSSSPLPGQVRAFLTASLSEPPRANAVAGFVEKWAPMGTDMWDGNNLRQISNDLKQIENGE